MRDTVLGMLVALVLSSGSAGCGSRPPAGKVPTDERLPDSVRPTAYKVDLRIDPRQGRFSGMVDIAIAVSEPAVEMLLHGQDLEVTDAEVRLADGRTIGVTYSAVESPAGWARLQFADSLPTGAATLRIIYHAPFATEGAGIYRSMVDGRYYVASQMEPLDARRALPSFDEPRFKVPFTVSITAPATERVFFNTGEIEAAPAADGMVRHQFATTLPLPTYLFSVAVGPYDLVEGKPLPANSLRGSPVPLRGIATARKGAQLEHALANTQALVEYLENYFGVAYPYDKLDLIAAPGASGAMENAGLVVYSESLLLLEPKAGVRQLRMFASVHAHELAHMWFGDYVTPAWWEDLWLNEAFATWIGNKAANAIFPDLGLDRSTQADALRAMAADSLTAARQIRQPIASTADINDAFDSITYSKGGGVLAMIESYIGAEPFRDGVRRHMQRFPNGVASSEDFFASLAEGARTPEAVQALRSFTDQPNAPLVSASLECRDRTPVARLSQSTYRPLGSSLPDRRWQIPACVAVYGVGPGSRACTLMSESGAELTLPAPASCNGALVPNADGAGYYRFTLPEQGWRSLLSHFDRLTPTEQIATVDSLAASHRAGQTGAAQLLDGIAKAAAATDLDVVMAGAELAWSLESLVPSERRLPLQTFAVRAFGARLDALRSVRTPTPQQARARTQLTLLLALFARDSGVRAQLHASGRAEAGLAAGQGPEPDLRSAAISVMTQEEGRRAFDAALVRARASTDELYRRDVLTGLGLAGTPETRAALWDAILDKPFGIEEMFAALFASLAHADTAEQAWVELEPRLVSTSQRLPPFARSIIPQFADRLCSKTSADRVRTYFTENAAAFPGHERNLSQVLERVGHCAALRAWDNGALAAAVASAR